MLSKMNEVKTVFALVDFLIQVCIIESREAGAELIRTGNLCVNKKRVKITDKLNDVKYIRAGNWRLWKDTQNEESK